MEMRETTDDGLNNAIEELFVAVRKYRQYLKRNHRDRLAGVLFIRSGTDFLVYSESEKYTQELLRLTWDAKDDRWSMSEATE